MEQNNNLDFNKFENDFLNLVKSNYPKTSDKIIEAYYFAKDAHNGVKRVSGEPYIVHPMCVATILIENNMDYATIIAGLLHDVVEDTTISLDVISKRFGETVAKLVDGVTKINKLTLKKENLTEADSMKRLLIAMGSDVRVIFIKLADRLHNMRTLGSLKREKQIRKAEETNELFIPIAERIGIRSIRSELQDLVIKYLKPDEYEKIRNEYLLVYEKQKDKFNDINKKILKILRDANIDASVSGWAEHIHSIYKKLSKEGISKIRGIYYFKVLVDTEDECYRALGLLHKHFNLLPNQISDFIAQPKSNGYQSLHSIMSTKEDGINFQVMIRTKDMDEVCEYGISSLWNDKDSDVMFSESIEKYNYLKDIVLSESDTMANTKNFIDAIKSDLQATSTWVFTPKFKPICLNSVSPNAIDFAYAVHSNIGHNAIGCIVNGKKASLAATLSSGDVVEIITTDYDKAPSRDWLSIASTVAARKKIREYFAKNTTSKNVESGKNLLESEMKKFGHSLGDVLNCFSDIQKEFNFVNFDDMFASVGYGSVTVNQIAKFVITKDEQMKCEKLSPVRVEGAARFSNMSFPRCCSAVPGDKIVGVLSKNGVAIHTTDCHNLKSVPSGQIFKAEWKENLNQKFNANLKIVAEDQVGLAAMLFGEIAKMNYNITKTVIRSSGERECEIEICVAVKNLAELEHFIKVIESIKPVKQVLRDFD